MSIQDHEKNKRLAETIADLENAAASEAVGPTLGVSDECLAMARKLVQHSRKERGLGRIDDDTAALLQFDIAHLLTAEQQRSLVSVRMELLGLADKWEKTAKIYPYGPQFDGGMKTGIEGCLKELRQFIAEKLG